MTRRLNGGDQDGQDIVNGQLKKLFDDDQFLTDLSRGVDPSQGSDALAGILLDFTKDVQEPKAAMPDWSTLLSEVVGQDSPVESESDFAETTVMQGSNPATQEFNPVSQSDSSLDAEDSNIVVPLASRREKRAKNNAKHSSAAISSRKSHPFLNGLVGAAAATLVIAGGGAAVYSADEGSPLYGVNQQLFGNQDSPSVVELASTLEEVDSRTASGDVAGARALLEQARAMLNSMDNNKKGQTEFVTTTEVAPAPNPRTKTVTVTPSPEPPVTETEVVTSTEVSTIVSTVVAPPVWAPEPEPTDSEPTTSAEPTTDNGGDLAPPQTPGD